MFYVLYSFIICFSYYREPDRVSKLSGTNESKHVFNFVFTISNNFLSQCIMFLRILLNLIESTYLLNMFLLVPDISDTL